MADFHLRFAALVSRAVVQCTSFDIKCLTDVGEAGADLVKTIADLKSTIKTCEKQAKPLKF